MYASPHSGYTCSPRCIIPPPQQYQFTEAAYPCVPYCPPCHMPAQVHPFRNPGMPVLVDIHLPSPCHYPPHVDWLNQRPPYWPNERAPGGNWPHERALGGNWPNEQGLHGDWLKEQQVASQRSKRQESQFLDKSARARCTHSNLAGPDCNSDHDEIKGDKSPTGFFTIAGNRSGGSSPNSAHYFRPRTKSLSNDGVQSPTSVPSEEATSKALKSHHDQCLCCGRTLSDFSIESFPTWLDRGYETSAYMPSGPFKGVKNVAHIPITKSVKPRNLESNYVYERPPSVKKEGKKPKPPEDQSLYHKEVGQSKKGVGNKGKKESDKSESGTGSKYGRMGQKKGKDLDRKTEPVFKGKTAEDEKRKSLEIPIYRLKRKDSKPRFDATTKLADVLTAKRVSDSSTSDSSVNRVPKLTQDVPGKERRRKRSDTEKSRTKRSRNEESDRARIKMKSEKPKTKLSKKEEDEAKKLDDERRKFVTEELKMKMSKNEEDEKRKMKTAKAKQSKTEKENEGDEKHAQTEGKAVKEGETKKTKMPQLLANKLPSWYRLKQSIDTPVKLKALDDYLDHMRESMSDTSLKVSETSTKPVPSPYTAKLEERRAKLEKARSNRAKVRGAETDRLMSNVRKLRDGLHESKTTESKAAPGAKSNGQPLGKVSSGSDLSNCSSSSDGKSEAESSAHYLEIVDLPEKDSKGEPLDVRAYVRNLFRYMDIELTSLKKVCRKEGGPLDRPRPVSIRFKNSVSRNLFWTKFFNLPANQKEYSQVWVRPDLGSTGSTSDMRRSETDL